MKFFITDSDGTEHEPPPIEGAVLEKYMQQDVRTVQDPKGLWLGDRDTWYDRGTNHHTQPDTGFIVREFERMGWFLSLNTFDDLAALVRDTGPVMISTSWQLSDVLQLTIDDGDY